MWRGGFLGPFLLVTLPDLLSRCSNVHLYASQDEVHMRSLWDQTQPGHMQAASMMDFSSNADTSFGAKKTVTFRCKMVFASHHNWK